jgi:hypothetical protein
MLTDPIPVQLEVRAGSAPTVPDVRAALAPVPLNQPTPPRWPCDRCGALYGATRRNRRYCSDSCRVMDCMDHRDARRRRDQRMKRPATAIRVPSRRARLAQMVADLSESELVELGP